MDVVRKCRSVAIAHLVSEHQRDRAGAFYEVREETDVYRHLTSYLLRVPWWLRCV